MVDYLEARLCNVEPSKSVINSTLQTPNPIIKGFKREISFKVIPFRQPSESEIQSTPLGIINAEDRACLKEEVQLINHINQPYVKGRWTKDEHIKFVEAIMMHGNEWKKVQKVVKSRSSIQARSHAQKFFKKLRNFWAWAKSSGIDVQSISSISKYMNVDEYCNALKILHNAPFQKSKSLKLLSELMTVEYGPKAANTYLYKSITAQLIESESDDSPEKMVEVAKNTNNQILRAPSLRHTTKHENLYNKRNSLYKYHKSFKKKRSRHLSNACFIIKKCFSKKISKKWSNRIMTTTTKQDVDAFSLNKKLEHSISSYQAISETINEFRNIDNKNNNHNNDRCKMIFRSTDHFKSPFNQIEALIPSTCIQTLKSDYELDTFFISSYLIDSQEALPNNFDYESHSSIFHKDYMK